VESDCELRYVTQSLLIVHRVDVHRQLWW